MWRRLAVWLFGLFVLSAVLGVVLHASEIENFTALLHRAKPLFLILAAILQACTYILVALVWAAVLEGLGTRLPLYQMIGLSIAKLFADQAVPTAGISGNVLLVEALGRRGAARPHAVAVMAMSIIGYYTAYIVMALLALTLLWVSHRATLLFATAISVFMIVALLILGVIFGLASKDRQARSLLHRFRLPLRVANLLSQVPANTLRDRVLLSRVTGLNSLVFLADAATLWVALEASGSSVPFSSAFIAFVLASIAATLGPIPMGLGSFEGVCILTLKALSVPLESAAAATLILRGFTLWIPLVPGLVLARRFMPITDTRVGRRHGSRN